MSDHLFDHVRPYLDRDPEERIAYIRAPRWIGHHVAQKSHRRLTELLERPSSLRTQGLMLVGPYANGKTMIAERFAVEHLRTSPSKRYGSPRRAKAPASAIFMPAFCRHCALLAATYGTLPVRRNNSITCCPASSRGC